MASVPRLAALALVAGLAVPACGLTTDVASSGTGGSGAGGAGAGAAGGGGAMPDASHASSSATGGGGAGGGMPQPNAVRRPIRVVADAAMAVPKSYSVHLSLDHASLVAAQASLASGDDVRVYREDGGFVELDRVLGFETTWNSLATEIWFETTTPVAAGATDARYWLYYGAKHPGAPPADPHRVFLFFDDFESGSLSRWRDHTPSFGAIATDQARSGTRSLKAASGADTFRWLTVDGLDQVGVAFESYWRLTDDAVDLSQTVRAGSGATNDDYETNLFKGKWDVAKIVANAWNEVTQPPGGEPPVTTNAWFRVTTLAVDQRFKMLVDGAQVVPDTGWSDVGTELPSGSVGFRAWNLAPNQSFWIDDARARKYVDPEPSLELGAEEPAVFPP